MQILVACEESQAVTMEFRKLGHEAYSCDIIDCSGGHPEWHIMQDVLPLLDGKCTFNTCDGTTHRINDRWDMIIAFPPCTHLAVSGAAHFEKKRADGRQRWGIDFFGQFLNADCDKISIENPVGIISGDYIPKWFPDLAEKYGLPIKPTQIIHPWMFGDNFSKGTCRWLKGLDPLVPKVTEQPELEWFEWVDKKTGRKKRQPLWFYEALTNTKTAEERAKVRSKTFPGIAKAMAEQWGNVSQCEVIGKGEDSVKKIEERKVTTFETDVMIDLAALKNKEPELFAELAADYPCESGRYIYDVIAS